MQNLEKYRKEIFKDDWSNYSNTFIFDTFSYSWI